MGRFTVGQSAAPKSKKTSVFFPKQLQLNGVLAVLEEAAGWSPAIGRFTVGQSAGPKSKKTSVFPQTTPSANDLSVLRT